MIASSQRRLLRCENALDQFSPLSILWPPRVGPTANRDKSRAGAKKACMNKVIHEQGFR
jgi:hypothetical protein